MIQQLLAEAGSGNVGELNLVSVEARGAEAAADWTNLKSPENYLGYQRTENFSSPGGAVRDKPTCLHHSRATEAQPVGPFGRLDNGSRRSC